MEEETGEWPGGKDFGHVLLPTMERAMSRGSLLKTVPSNFKFTKRTQGKMNMIVMKLVFLYSNIECMLLMHMNAVYGTARSKLQA